MNKLSVVISAYNEEEKIEECLSSVSFADEIIVVDCSSTDKTADIAKRNGATVLKRPNDPMLNTNKNYGFSKASHEWILSLDADERVTAALRADIQEVVNKDSNTSAYRIPRKNIIFGKWIEHTGWYPDFQTRLFRKGKGEFACKHVHEQLTVEGEVEEVTSPMEHQSYKSVREFLLKFFTLYAPNEAHNLLEQEKYTFSPRDFISRPWKEFLNRFYFHKGYKDGVHGLVLSCLMAFYHFVVICFVWEKKKFINDYSESRSVLETEVKTMKQDFKYWTLTSRVTDSKNPLISVISRIRRKLR